MHCHLHMDGACERDVSVLYVTGYQCSLVSRSVY